MRATCLTHVIFDHPNSIYYWVV